MEQVTGADLGAKALQAEGVDTFFYILSAPIVADCLELGMKGISVRNETAAGMMAHGYSRVTGKPGVVLSSHGPGTANVLPAMMNALADASPVISLGASANLEDRHGDVFQEMDQVAMMRPVTKWAHQVTHTHKIPELISTAFRHALTPPHGPVYLDMPNDAQRLHFIRGLVSEGYADRVVVGHDIYSKHRLTSYGGHGYAHFLENVAPRMEKKGFAREHIDAITTGNPARVLAFAPPS